MTMKLKKLITALFIGLFFSLHAQQEDANKILEKSLSQAKKENKSFNQIAVEALMLGAGVPLVPQRDFSEIIGSLTSAQASQIEAEINLQNQIDPKLWK